MHPCGRAVDWIQFPFETDARLFANATAPLVRLRWVYTDQPFLPADFPNAVLNRIWDADQIDDVIPGQLPVGANNYRQDARWVLPALAFSGHMCHPEWFATGEPYPSTLPPTVYLTGWIPECCAMACDATDCTRTPVNGEPASQVTQYAIPAVEATGTTPAIRQYVVDAASIAGGNWPASGQEWYPAGVDGPVAYVVENLAQPDGTPYQRSEQMTFANSTVHTETLTDADYERTLTVGAVAGALTLQVLGTQIQMSGTNLIVAPSILPPGIVYGASGVVEGIGTTQAGAAPLTRGAWYVYGIAPLDVAFVLPAAAGAIVDVYPQGADPVEIFPPPGESHFGLAADASVTLSPGGAPYYVWRFVRIDQPSAPAQWAREKLRGDGTESSGVGTVTSVAATAPAAGFTISGSPITGAGTFVFALANDLAALEALAGLNTMYYRSGVSTWTAVTIGSGLTFGGPILATTVQSGYVLIRDEKGATTEGGTATAGTYVTRVLNTEANDPGGHCVLSGNRFTLSAGTWRIRARAPAYRVGRHQAKLRNTTGAVDLIIGTPAYSETANNVEGWSWIEGEFTVTGGQALEIAHWVTTSNGTQDFGLYGDGTNISVYTVVELQKVA